MCNSKHSAKAFNIGKFPLEKKTMMMIIMRMIMMIRRRRGMIVKSLYRKVVEEKSGLTVGFRASPLPSRKLPRVSESALSTLY